MAKGDRTAKALKKVTGMRHMAAIRWHTDRRVEILDYAKAEGVTYTEAALALWHAENEHDEEVDGA